MTSSDFSPGHKATPLKYPAREIPHITLEINRTCNMRCLCCYNIDRSWVKSLTMVYCPFYPNSNGILTNH